MRSRILELEANALLPGSGSVPLQIRSRVPVRWPTAEMSAISSSEALIRIGEPRWPPEVIA